MAITNGNLITLTSTDTNYVLTAPGAFDIFGNNLTNNITGNDDVNLISGADGNDLLKGMGGNDSIHGGDGGDTLDGGEGSDYLAGGYGNDSYVIDDSGDLVVENANEGAMDIVYTGNVDNYTLTANTEYLTMTGASHLRGYGNELDNRMIGNTGNNLLSGEGGNDQIYGGLGNDTLFGGNGNDVLNGQENQNDLHGGAGDDRYYITVGLDSIFENADEGNDTVYTQASFTLADNFENLTISGSSNAIGRGNAVRNTLIGNDGDNILYGEGGDDSLSGVGGKNTLVGGVGNDIYTIHSADDVIVENPGEGIDTVWIYQTFGHYTLAPDLENLRMNFSGAMYEQMAGNAAANYITVKGVSSVDGYGGNDTIIAESVAVVNGGDGNDSIAVSGSSHYSLPTVHGNAGNDVINQFSGKAGYFYGDDGNDVFNIGDSLGSWFYGGTGNDTYTLYSTEGAGYMTALIENANEGTDLVKSDVSFSLDPNSPVTAAYAYSEYIENLTLLGTGNIDGYGNALGNYLYGNSGNNLLEGRGGNDYLIGYGGSDTLLGGDGNDTLSVNHSQAVGVTVNSTGSVQMTGGAGNDTFWMPRGLVGDHSAGANQISIMDFTHGVDKIMLSIGNSNTKPTVLNTITANAGDTLAGLVNQAAAANASSAAPALTSFTFSGNTYLVFDQSADATFNASADWAVKIVGAPTLTLSDFSYQSLA